MAAAFSPRRSSMLVPLPMSCRGSGATVKMEEKRAVWSRRRVSRLFSSVSAPHLLLRRFPWSRQRLHLRLWGAFAERITLHN